MKLATRAAVAGEASEVRDSINSDDLEISHLGHQKNII